MAVVVGLRMVGGTYHRGRRCSGWGEFHLDNGREVFVGEDLPGMDGILAEADKLGHDTQQYRQRLAVWVKTGQMPPA